MCCLCCRTPPRIPQVQLPEEPFLQVASALTFEINRGFAVLRNIAYGKDLKKFLVVCLSIYPVIYISNGSVGIGADHL